MPDKAFTNVDLPQFVWPEKRKNECVCVLGGGRMKQNYRQNKETEETRAKSEQQRKLRQTLGQRVYAHDKTVTLQVLYRTRKQGNRSHNYRIDKHGDRQIDDDRGILD